MDQEDPLEEKMATPPVFLPGESHEQRSLAGYSPWGCKDLDTTERLTHRGSNVLCARKKRSDCYYLKVLSEIRECCALQ